MTIEFRCEQCATRYEVNDQLSGERTNCKKCKAELVVPYPPLELPDEVTTGGSVVYRHEAGTRDFILAAGDLQNVEQISNHIERHVDTVECVFHEVISDLVHVDVHCVTPTEQRPYHTLVTSGMSDLPMHAPPDAEECRFAELTICLPPDWPMTKADFQDPDNYWPIEWLKILARFPHEYETWLFEGHTVPNGDPPEPFAENSNFCAWMLFPSVLAPPDFSKLKISEEKTIYFFAIYPLFEGEMNLKLNRGTDALIKKFTRQKVTDLLDVNRKDTSKPGFWPFG